MGAGASAAAAEDAQVEFKSVYCRLNMCEVKHPKLAMPLVLELANREVQADVKGVAAYVALGEATNYPNDAHKEYMKNRLTFFCLYDDREGAAGRDGAHHDWVSENLLQHCATDDPTNDVELIYRGMAEFLGKPGASSSDSFYMWGSFQCKSEEAVKVAIWTIKAHGMEMIEEEEGAIGCMVIPPASYDSDMDSVLQCEKEDLDQFHVSYMLAFRDTAAWDLHQKQPGWAPFLHKLAGQLEDQERDIKLMLWFDKAVTRIHGSEYAVEDKTDEGRKHWQELRTKQLADACSKVTNSAIICIKKMTEPTDLMKSVVQAAFLIFSGKDTKTPPDWDACRKWLSNSATLNNIRRFTVQQQIDFKSISAKLKDIVAQEDFKPEKVYETSEAAAPLCKWVLCVDAWCKAQE